MWKQNVYEQMRSSSMYFGKGKDWIVGKGKERVALIKSLIYMRA
jgi:hypothetical protein